MSKRVMRGSQMCRVCEARKCVCEARRSHTCARLANLREPRMQGHSDMRTACEARASPSVTETVYRVRSVYCISYMYIYMHGRLQS